MKLSQALQKEVAYLPAKTNGKIFPRLEALALNPRPVGCKKLKGGDNEWRIRVGDYRIVYVIDDRKHVAEVVRARHRSEVYEP